MGLRQRLEVFDVEDAIRRPQFEISRIAVSDEPGERNSHDDVS